LIERSFIKELTKIVGRENVLSDMKDLIAYSYDATPRQEMPDVIVFPHSTTEVSAVMKAAHREKIPVVPRGAGTNLSGGTIPIKGGIILETSRMNRILEIDTANRRAVVEPGVVNLDLQNALAPLGFFYPPDPASQKSSTLGGNIGENAGGPLCLRYGVTSKYVCGMEVVLANGEVVDIGGYVDDPPGYDLRGLLVGSEGILGVATKLILHIIPKPEASRTMLAIFDTLEDGGQAVSDIISVGIIPGALELLDKTMCWVIEQSVLWKGRRGAFGAVARICPLYSVNDGTVPRDKLALALHKVGEIAEKYHLIIANVAHAGDGNLHPLILFDAKNPDECAAAKKAGEEVLDACIALGGTITGEHGIGLEKLDAMPHMFDSADLAAMRKVKLVFDPDDVLNPGKMLPPDVDESQPTKEKVLQ